jgi:single-strand DNA-binding protein
MEKDMLTTNKLFVRGHLGQDPKMFGKVCKVSIGTNQSWKDKDGKRQEKSSWVPVTILVPKLATWVSENLKKGDPVYCEGHVEQQSYKDKTGDMIYSTEVIAHIFDGPKPVPAEVAEEETPF